MTLLDVLHPSVEHDSVDGVEAITLAAGALEATFVPEVGMVGTSLRHAGVVHEQVTTAPAVSAAVSREDLRRDTQRNVRLRSGRSKSVCRAFSVLFARAPTQP